MFNKLILLSVVVSGGLLSSAITAEAQPCLGSPSICYGSIAKMPPMQPIGNPVALNPNLNNPVLNLPPMNTGPYPVPPKKGPHWGIDVTLGGGGYAHGGYGNDGFVSCREARFIVKRHGYRPVRTESCGDGEYSFIGQQFKARRFPRCHGPQTANRPR